MGACGSKKDTVSPVPGATAQAAASQPAATPAAAVPASGAAGKACVGGDYECAEDL